MATTRRTRFSRRIPDHVTDELVVVLKENDDALEFNKLFELVYENLKEKNAVSGGEEMLRLRAYEKLQNLLIHTAMKADSSKVMDYVRRLENYDKALIAEMC
jgi:hypothetical protein